MSAPHANILQILENCEALIAQAKTQEALSQLIALKEKGIHKKFIGFANQFHTLEEQFRSGTLTNEEFLARKSRVNTSILATIQQLEAELKKAPSGIASSGSSRLKLIIGFIVVGILLFAGYQLFWSKTQAGNEALNCLAGHKKAVKIAQFQQDATGGFSESLKAALQSDLNLETYNIAVEAPQVVGDAYYHDTIRIKHFEQTCDTSGLFVNGRWDKDLEVFNCWIDLFDLEVKIPGMESNQSIVLNNPPGISFSVREDSRFLADFILGILKAHDGNAFEALQVFTKLEKDTLLLADEKIKGHMAYFKAMAYTTRGDQQRAAEQFEQATNLVPMLKPIAQKNLKVAEQVAKIMHNDPELKPILTNYLKEDSLLRAANEPTPTQPIEEEPEATVVEKVAAKMREQQENPPPTKETEPPLEEKKNAPSKNKIKTIQLAGKTWTAENLNIEVADSWCYGGDPKNCEKYGRLIHLGSGKKGLC